MKGATAVPERDTRIPKSSRTTTIGINQYFLCSRMRAHSSSTNDPSRRSRAIRSKSCPPLMSVLFPLELPEILRLVRRAWFRTPICRRVWLLFQPELVAADAPKNEGHRREEPVEEDPERDPRHDPADGIHERHPGDEHGPDQSRRHDPERPHGDCQDRQDDREAV